MIQQTWRALRERLDRATPRERAGIAAVAALGALACAFGAFDWALQAGAREREAAEAKAAAEGLLDRDSDSAFQMALGENANKVWRWSIVAQSPGVARAEAAALVEGLALEAGLADADTVADELPEDTGEVGAIPVQLQASFDWGAFQALLNAIAASDVSLQVRAVAMAPSGEGDAALTMTLVAPYVAEAPP